MAPDALPDPVDTGCVLALLRAGDIDGAIEAGLMQSGPEDDPGLAADDLMLLQAARERLQSAWAARERHRARADRLARLAAERDARRARPATAASKPPLPPAAASALARARAKASAKP